MTNQHPYSYMQLEKINADDLDMVLADGWRHFGTYFFRDMMNWHQDKYVNVIPLRINLSNFTFSKSQRKILRQNKSTKVVFRDAFVDDEKEAMFYKHIARFESNVPESIYNFLSEIPAQIPCHTVECCLFDENDKLYAVSFLDIGKFSTSSVYAMFDPDYSKLSPGLHTLLCEIQYAIENKKKYLYLGYAYQEASKYDYKKKFSALEVYDWKGNWKDFVQIQS